MYPIVAVIADKMPTVTGLWFDMLVFAAPFALGAVRTWLAWALLPMAIALSAWLGYWSYHEAFLEAEFSDAVWMELGQAWVVNSLASTLLPTAVATAALWWSVRSKRRMANQDMHGPGGSRAASPPSVL